MGTAIKHPVPARVEPSFVIFDIRGLWRSALSVRVWSGMVYPYGNSGHQRIFNARSAAGVFLVIIMTSCCSGATRPLAILRPIFSWLIGWAILYEVLLSCGAENNTANMLNNGVLSVNSDSRGRVVACWTCDHKLAGSNLTCSYCVPTPTPLAIPSGSV